MMAILCRGLNHGENPMRTLTTIVLAALLASTAHAQSGDAIRIGVLNDMSGVYSDDQGPGSVIAAQMAVED